MFFLPKLSILPARFLRFRSKLVVVKRKWSAAEVPERGRTRHPLVCFYTHLQDTHFRWKLKWRSALLGALRHEHICQFCSCRIKTESQTWKEMTAVEWFTFIKMLSTLKQCCPQESLWGANSTSAAGILWYAILFVPLNIQITTSGILFCGCWNVDRCLV